MASGTLVVHVDHCFDQLLEQFICPSFCQFAGDQIAERAALAKLYEHEDAIGGGAVPRRAVELHDVGMFQLLHDCDFFEFPGGHSMEVDPGDLFDCDEFFAFVVVALVDVAEGATAEPEEPVVEEALVDLGVAGEVQLCHISINY